MSPAVLRSAFRLVEYILSNKKWRTALLIVLLISQSLTFVLAFTEVPAQTASQSAAAGIPLYLPLALRNAERLAWIGPDGGTITALAFDPQHPEVIFAGTWGAGVFRSTDAGESWRPSSAGLAVLYINSLAVDPKDPHVLYAGTYRGKLYKSVDAGANWYLSSQGVQDEAIVYAIAIDPLNTQNVYIATRGVSNLGAPPWRGVVYKSTDAGDTWSPSLTNIGGVGLQDWVYSLSIHPNAPHIIYAAAHEQGPYRSVDAGLVWEVVENGITDTSGRAIAVEPHSVLPATAYFGVWHGGGVFKTTNGGDSWFQISNYVYGNKVFNIAIDPQDVSNVYLGTFTAGVMKTVDGGENWSIAGLYNKEIFSLALNPVDPKVIYAGTTGNGLYRSLAAGEDWKPSQNGLRGSPATSLIVDGMDPQTYYVSGRENGVSISTDHGKTWLDYNTNLPDPVVNGLISHPVQENVLYALTGASGLYRRQLDGSDGWIQAGEGLPVVTAVESQEKMEEAAYPDLLSDPPGISHTTAYVPLLAMAFSPADSSIVFMGTQGAGIYKSLDGGLSWVPAGLPGETVRTLALDLFDPEIIHAATETAGGLYASVDGGLTWEDGGLSERIVHAITPSNDAEHTIFAGTDDGVYRRTDAGWVQSGLGKLSVQAIAVHPDIRGLVFAAAEEGAYLSWDDGLHWHLATPELSGIAVSSIRVDPHDPRLVYFSAPSHGILRVQMSLPGQGGR